VVRPRNVIVEVVAEGKRECPKGTCRVVARVEGVDGCADDKEVLRIPMLQTRRDDACDGDSQADSPR
jgi:hypothetical protein